MLFMAMHLAFVGFPEDSDNAGLETVCSQQLITLC